MLTKPGHAISRRRFLGGIAATSVVSAIAAVPLLGSCRDRITLPSPPSGRRFLPQPTVMSGDGVLAAAPGVTALGPDSAVTGWFLNGVLPSPTIRLRQSEIVSLQFRNQLPESSILHWHGMLVPSEADGHPRDAVPTGATYNYGFTVVNRAGTYWYHPHAHRRTAAQIQLGLAGFLIVTDPEEDRLELPRDAQEILLMLQDRDDAPAAAYVYAPTAEDLRTGQLRETAYGNGVPLAAVVLRPGPYRLRILNASQARVYRLGLSDGTPLTIIGNDGGLLPAPVTVDSAYLGIGERLDCIVTLSADGPRSGINLRSLPFASGANLPGAYPQGMPMDLLEIHCTNEAALPPLILPASLSSISPLPEPVATRTFAFSSAGGEPSHWIAGRQFEMDRIDVRVPLGQVERWEFVNDSDLPHPVHVHGCQFQVVSRTGGRNTVFPYEGGWKDTVLMMPNEIVAVHIRFEAHPGLFLLHCHNLQHEDQGMMLNVEVT